MRAQAITQTTVHKRKHKVEHDRGYKVEFDSMREFGPWAWTRLTLTVKKFVSGRRKAERVRELKVELSERMRVNA